MLPHSHISSRITRSCPRGETWQTTHAGVRPKSQPRDERQPLVKLQRGRREKHRLVPHVLVDRLAVELRAIFPEHGDLDPVAVLAGDLPDPVLVPQLWFSTFSASGFCASRRVGSTIDLSIVSEEYSPVITPNLVGEVSRSIRMIV